VDAGDTWTNLDWAEAAKTEAEEVHTMLGAFVASPATALALASLKELTTGSNKTLLASDPTQPTTRVISGVPLYTSPAIADGIVWGIPQAHSIVVIRQDASVVTDSSVFFASDRVAVRATRRVGFGFSYPAAVVKVTLSP
jgi:HK97 family phage major capsid protein